MPNLVQNLNQKLLGSLAGLELQSIHSDTLLHSYIVLIHDLVTNVTFPEYPAISGSMYDEYGMLPGDTISS